MKNLVLNGHALPMPSYCKAVMYRAKTWTVNMEVVVVVVEKGRACLTRVSGTKVCRFSDNPPAYTCLHAVVQCKKNDGIFYTCKQASSFADIQIFRKPARKYLSAHAVTACANRVLNFWRFSPRKISLLAFVGKTA